LTATLYDIMPTGGEIGVPGRQRPDAMKVIGQNDDGLDGEWPALAGRLEHLPKVGNRFGYTRCQKFFPPPLTLTFSPRWGIGANLRLVFIINPFVVILSEAKNLHSYRHFREILHCAALRSE